MCGLNNPENSVCYNNRDPETSQNKKAKKKKKGQPTFYHTHRVGLWNLLESRLELYFLKTSADQTRYQLNFSFNYLLLYKLKKIVFIFNYC